MERRRLVLLVVAVLAVCGFVSGSAWGNILSQHTFYWYDNGAGGVQVGYNAPIAALAGTELVIIDEWFVDSTQTTQWYNGGAVVGLPGSPFAGVPVAVAGQEMYLYEVQNVTYGNGDGHSFSDPVPIGPGVNGMSGYNIIEHPIPLGVPITNQFVAEVNNGLDTTPGLPAWQFQAFSGSKYEWDIQPVNGAGVLLGQTGLFGYTVPAHTTVDTILDGWIHSWNSGFDPQTGAFVGSFQVNIANATGGFSGPMIPEPMTLSLLTLGGLSLLRRRKA